MKLEDIENYLKPFRSRMYFNKMGNLDANFYFNDAIQNNYKDYLYDIPKLSELETLLNYYIFDYESKSSLVIKI